MSIGCFYQKESAHFQFNLMHFNYIYMVLKNVFFQSEQCIKTLTDEKFVENEIMPSEDRETFSKIGMHYVYVLKRSLLRLIALKDLSKGGDGLTKNNSALSKLWFMESRQPFSFLNSPVASCDVKQSMFCSTKDICL